MSMSVHVGVGFGSQSKIDEQFPRKQNTLELSIKAAVSWKSCVFCFYTLEKAEPNTKLPQRAVQRFYLTEM